MNENQITCVVLILSYMIYGVFSVIDSKYARIFLSILGIVIGRICGILWVS
jgi:hypothetical protein